MKSNCPYCTKEIDADATGCPSCGAAYEPDTLESLRIDFEESDEGDSEKQDSEIKGA